MRRIWRYVVGRKEIECRYCDETQEVRWIGGAAAWQVRHATGECDYYHAPS